MAYSYFIQFTILATKGPNDGWDKLEGGLSPNAIVMSWGTEGGIAVALKKLHDNTVVCVFGSLPSWILNWAFSNWWFTTLEKRFVMNQIAKLELSKQTKHIIGVQANVWQNICKTSTRWSYGFPRASALSEVSMDEKELKDYSKLRGMKVHADRLRNCM